MFAVDIGAAFQILGMRALEIDVRRIGRRAAALPRANLTAPAASGQCSSPGSRLISTLWTRARRAS